MVTGNTIVLKPSQLTPENAFVFAQIVEEVGVPAGVFNIVNGRGSVVGHELAANPKVGMVSLTGSVEAGQSTMEAASKNITKVSLELGGKAPAIVMADADLDLVAKAIIDSRVDNTGQVCNNAERVYVDKKVKDEFTKKLVAGMQLSTLIALTKKDYQTKLSVILPMLLNNANKRMNCYALKKLTR